MREKKLLENVNNLLEAENLQNKAESYSSNDPRLIGAAMEMAERTKSILGGLYYDFRKSDTGYLRKVKNKLIGKIANIVRNTLERPLLTQQKFNEQTFFLLQNLIEENKRLREELEELKNTQK